VILVIPDGAGAASRITTPARKRFGKLVDHLDACEVVGTMYIVRTAMHGSAAAPACARAAHCVAQLDLNSCARDIGEVARKLFAVVTGDGKALLTAGDVRCRCHAASMALWHA